SKASIATLLLFCLIFHWNAWMDGIIYMDSSDKYPLSSFLQTLVIKTDFTAVANNKSIPNYNLLSDKNLKCAQIVLGTLPLIVAYPFIQKYFTQGATLGSVKE
ncbi:MAG: carbohydrate ABC transporter permease, partial [Roseburia sp.]|nr:carbohydrate ABC transporter permease [Roseburia sp.]